MRLRKPRSERIPRAITRRLRDLHKRPLPEIPDAQLLADVGRKVGSLGQDGDARPYLNAYIQAHKAKWLLQLTASHNELVDEIRALAAEAEALVEYRRILCQDQRDIMDDLDAAVSHALERVTDPDAPYHEPIRLSERRGGKR
ncbi:hypothetical protein Q5425_06095 [Amycolatopsis sp. A133]|jgi:hypothetical protein|uniref:hypothetical protein n=1 Tax=Amycolatopsis sp. A133 TaxID=3064472 RepID=UPI0027FEAA9B|nr:hypothetical protein [Amycolatopsis sp. A133]MDQ7803292.1 hypothetical protein [Amycolatopsis sp. A133]